jgi:hypothetical protein
MVNERNLQKLLVLSLRINERLTKWGLGLVNPQLPNPQLPNL